MKVIPFSELYKYDYSVELVDYTFNYKINDTYDCTKDGRYANGFLFYADIESTHIFANRTYNFKKNDFVYFPVGSKSYSIYTKCGNPPSGMNGINIKFHLKDSEGNPFVLSEDVLIISDLIEKNYKNQLFEIVHILSSKEPPMYIKAKFYELLTDLSKSLNENDKPTEYHQIVNGIRFIEENYCRKITIKDAADACYMSESYFRKLFTKYHNISPIKYINNLRLKKADELLKSGLFSMTEVSEAIGIDNPSYFSWFYKKHTSQIPSHITHKNKQ